MKKILVPIIALAMCLGIAVAADAAKPTTTTYTFTAMDGSNVDGKVTVMALPNGRTHVRIQAQGLNANREYAFTYSTSTNCTETSDQRTMLERVTTSTHGSVNLNKRLEVDASTIGSIAIRSGDGTVLVACASTP